MFHKPFQLVYRKIQKQNIQNQGDRETKPPTTQNNPFKIPSEKYTETSQPSNPSRSFQYTEKNQKP